MIARFFVDRPIFATVISLVIMLAGGVAVFTLPVAQYPDVTPPTVQVTAFYPGANATTVRDTVAAPIEEQVSGVEGMMYMSSRCTNDGSYTLTVTFKLGTDADMAQVLVQNRVSLALPVVPQLVQNEGISVKKMSPNTLMIVNLISDGRYDDLRLSNYATIEVRDELGRLPGIGGVGYIGQRDYSMRAWLDTDKLAALNLKAMDVVTAISQQNVQVAAGQIGQRPVPKGQQFQLTITTLGRLSDPEEFENIIIKSGVDTTLMAVAPLSSSSGTSTSGTDGTTGAAAQAGTAAETSTTTGIVRLKDVVTRTPDGRPNVELGAQQYDQSCTLNGRPSVGLTIYQLPGSNALETAKGVRAKMKELKSRFPDGMDYKIVYDTSPFIEESVSEVFLTLRDAVILVAIVVLLFLQDWRAMILPMIDVPVSLIGTFAVMSLMGFTLNNLTLFGLVLAIGIVVDDAIVVLENIERQMATGLDARAATIKAMEEITGPVLAITLVLSAVFVPCCFLGGITGQFFRQFAVTIAVSTIISAINALTMTPSRAVLIFKTDGKDSGAQHRHEALPWWIFAVIGGTITWWVGPELLGGRWGLPAAAADPEPGEARDWQATLIEFLIYFPPGMLAGGLLGRLIIRPVNFGLGWFFRWFNSQFYRLTMGYGKCVGGALRVSVIVLLIYGGLLAATYWQFDRTPTGFIPQQDKGYLILNVQMPDSASVERTERVMARIERIAQKTPGVQHTLGISGQSLILNAKAPNLGSMYIILDDFDHRRKPGLFARVAAARRARSLEMLFRSGPNLTADAIAADLQHRCREGEDPEHPGVRAATVTAFGAPPVDGLGTTAGFNLIIQGRGNVSLDQLDRVSNRIVDKGNQTKGLEGLFNSSGANTPWLKLEIDRTKCQVLGVMVSDIFDTLQVYLGSYYVNNFNQFGRTWQVNIQADPKFRDQVADILKLQVRNKDNQMVRMGTIMDVVDTSGPVMVMRYNMYAATSIIGNPAPGTGSAQAIELMQEVAQSQLRQSMQYDWSELAYLQKQAGTTAMWFFALAVAFVFLVLAAQYESWKLPLAVILVVPMCLLCSIVGVNLGGIEVSIFTQIGFVVLVGLACKNAILIVEFAKQKMEAGAPLREATLEAARLRLRPIVMTSFAFIFGVLPLVFAQGAGAEMRFSLGMAVFSGMLGVTLFGIFLTPVFFYTLQWFGRDKASQHAPTPDPVESPARNAAQTQG